MFELEEHWFHVPLRDFCCHLYYLGVWCSCVCSRLLLDTGEADRQDYCSLLATTLHKLQARISKIVISHWHHDHLGGLTSVLQTVCRGKYIHKYAHLTYLHIHTHNYECISVYTWLVYPQAH